MGRKTRVGATLLAAACSACSSGEPPVAEPPLGHNPDSISAAAGDDASRRAGRPTDPERIRRAMRSYGVLEFIGEDTIPSATQLEGTEVGGLSGITFAGDDRYFVVSDDRGTHGPGRIYLLQINLDDGTLDPGDVELRGWTAVLGDNGRPLVAETFDLEGIALGPDSTLYLASEGEAAALIPPFVAQQAADGRLLRRFELPTKFLPKAGGTAGVRRNMAFESLSISPSGRYVFTATENALAQDGPEAGRSVSSPSRLLVFDRESGQAVSEYLYEVSPIGLERSRPLAFNSAGLADLAAIDDQHMVTLERSFAAGIGFHAQLYCSCIEDADDISSLESLTAAGAASPPQHPVPVRKVLLLDLAEVDIRLDNLEGIGFGPSLPDGRRTLLLVSDNNFNADLQITQFLAFAAPADMLAACEGLH